MRVLITGASGFIGSNLTQRCLDEGWSVDCVDDLSNGHLEFLPSKQGCWVHDFSSPFILSRIEAQSFDIVFHLAAVPRVSYSVEYPFRTNDVNVTHTLRMLDSCRKNVNRVVFASSSSVYGGASVLPTPETHPKDPKSPYALQKSVIEDYLKLYSDLYGLDSVSLRFFNVFGKNQIAGGAYATAISSWLNAIHRGKPMRSDGDGTQSRDMCHVDNIVDACVRAAKHPDKLNADRFNVACGERVTNQEILNLLLERFPAASHYVAPFRPGDVMHTQADVSKAEKVLGYTPVTRFYEGLAKTIEWFDSEWDMINSLKDGM